MTRPLKKLSLAAALLSLSLGAQSAQARQLNIDGFAQCLREKQAVNWNVIESGYSFGPLDLLLPFLAVYPGTRAPEPLALFQDAANDQWSTQWEKTESELARQVVLHPPRFPTDLLGTALGVCPPADLFCAALMSHNVLRTLGRYPQGERHHPDGAVTDYNPEWFKKNRGDWVAALPSIQARMISLRADGGGDRWGEWYHAFGILAYAIHAIRMGIGPGGVDFVARMNEVLNPLLAGEPEDPAKAQLDRDSARLSWQYLMGSPTPSPNLDCQSPPAFVALPAINSVN